jgi:hypothetical protein
MGMRDAVKRIRDDSSSGKSLEESDTVSSSSNSPENRADTEDFYRLLLALGEMQMYGHVLNKTLEQDGGKKGNIASDTVDDITGNTVEFIGSFDVIEVAERHGIKWDDVLDKISEGEVIRK